MDRFHTHIVGLIALVAALACAPARADDQFLTSLSNIVTRAARKEVRGEKYDFTLGSLVGHVRAVDPDERLAIAVKAFELAGDQVEVSLTASGRFVVDGTAGPDASLYMVVEVRVSIVAEARFLKQGEQFFIEPIVKDLELSLTVLEVLPDELGGSPELLAGLTVATVNKNKEKILAEVNKRIGKRPL